MKVLDLWAEKKFRQQKHKRDNGKVILPFISNDIFTNCSTLKFKKTQPTKKKTGKKKEIKITT